MENSNISSILKSLNPEDEKGLEALTEKVVLKAREEIRNLINIMHLGNKIEADKASSVLLDLGDLVLNPMLDSLDSDNAENYIWEMETVVSLQLLNRSKIAKVFNDMLLDERTLKKPDFFGAVEEEYIIRRVCDEAYLMMRRLLALEEDEEEQFINKDVFLNMSDEEKDNEISRVKSTKKWINLTTLFLNEDEIE